MPVQIAITSHTIIYSGNSFARRIGLKNNGKFIGQLNFHNNNLSTLPADAEVKVDGNSFYHINYYVADFANVMAILKAKPQKFLFFNGSGSGFENGIAVD
jgi:hypothetical protein